MPDCTNQSIYICRGNIVHDLLGRTCNIAAALAKDIDLMQGSFVDLLRRSKGQQLLGVDTAVEDQVIAVLSLQELVIHDRLYRLQNVQTDIDQMRNKGCDLAAGMHLNRDAGIMVHIKEFAKPGLQKIHKHLLGEEGGNLRPQVISVMSEFTHKHIDPRPVGTRRFMTLTPIYLTTNLSGECL